MKQNCDITEKVLKVKKQIENCDELMKCLLEMGKNETN